MNQKNKELRDLKTTQAGSTDLHETRTTGKQVKVQPPVAGPGPYYTDTQH